MLTLLKDAIEKFRSAFQPVLESQAKSLEIDGEPSVHLPERPAAGCDLSHCVLSYFGSVMMGKLWAKGTQDRSS